MDMFDFNTAEARGDMSELIPDRTVALIVLKLRPGGQGPGGWLKASNDGSCLMADCEFTVASGQHARRKFWGNFIVQADNGCTDGQKTAEGISRSMFRSILESARQILPAADDEKSMAARKVGGWADFDGMVFCGKIGIDPGKLKIPNGDPQGEKYPDKNKLSAAITADNRAYISPVGVDLNAAAPAQTNGVVTGNGGTVGAGAGTQAAAVSKPAWAQ
jgi:hypothetical protein